MAYHPFMGYLKPKYIWECKNLFIIIYKKNKKTNDTIFTRKKKKKILEYSSTF